MKKITTFVTFSCVFLLAIFTYNKLTDGFSIREIKSTFPYQAEYDVALNTEELKLILNQPFHYIGKGCQSYAFESNCGEYVLKFFKQKHLRSVDYLRNIPLPEVCAGLVENKIERRKQRVRKLFASCKLCFEELQDETQIIALHLNHTTSLQKKVTLIDPLGFNHTIEIDQYQFVIQKKGVKIERVFADLVARTDDEKIKNKITELVDLLIERSQKGISDLDGSFAQNIAFADNTGRPFFVDIGMFYKDEAVKTKEAALSDISCRLGSLRHWSEARIPKLARYIDQEAKKYQVN